MAELDKQRRRLVSQIASKPDDRITIRETDDGLGIHNPSRRFMPVVLFLLLWLGGWGVGEFFVLYEIFSGGWMFADMFLIIWVTFWTIGGAFAWLMVLYQLFGVEQLFITSGAVVHEIGLWKLRRRRVFPIGTVGGFKLGKGIAGANRKGATKGTIVYDVSGRAKSFGIGMSDEEAKLSLAAIERHLSKHPAGGAAQPKPET